MDPDLRPSSPKEAGRLVLTHEAGPAELDQDCLLRNLSLDDCVIHAVWHPETISIEDYSIES